jgi:hypothetical protein
MEEDTLARSQLLCFAATMGGLLLLGAAAAGLIALI